MIPNNCFRFSRICSSIPPLLNPGLQALGLYIPWIIALSVDIHCHEAFSVEAFCVEAVSVDAAIFIQNFRKGSRNLGS